MSAVGWLIVQNAATTDVRFITERPPSSRAGNCVPPA